MTIFHFKEAPTPSSGKMPEDYCPTCNERLDGVTSLDANGMPDVGDISLCAYCGELLEFDEDMKLVLLTEEQWDELPQHSKNEMIKIQELVRSSSNPYKH